MLIGQTGSIHIPYRIKNKWGVANGEGQITCKPKFEETFPSTCDRIRFSKNGKYGFINPEGEVIVKPIYLKATDFFNSGRELLSKVSTKDTTFFIGLNDEPIQPIHGCGGSHSIAYNPVTLINKNDSIGVKSWYGDTIIKPQYKKIISFRIGQFIAVQNFELKFGILNLRSDTIYDFDLDSVKLYPNDQSNPLYFIYKNGQIGILDSQGIVQANPLYDNIIPYSTSGGFRFYTAFREKKKLGYLYRGIEFWE
ncbi:MAG: hypothetical protein ACJA0Q_001293 [Saprospiraceae bacterium]|jgi:hypothetical protein